jgi:hypothetical protein
MYPGPVHVQLLVQCGHIIECLNLDELAEGAAELLFFALPLGSAARRAPVRPVALSYSIVSISAISFFRISFSRASRDFAHFLCALREAGLHLGVEINGQLHRRACEKLAALRALEIVSLTHDSRGRGVYRLPRVHDDQVIASVPRRRCGRCRRSLRSIGRSSPFLPRQRSTLSVPL